MCLPYHNKKVFFLNSEFQISNKMKKKRKKKKLRQIQQLFLVVPVVTT